MVPVLITTIVLLGTRLQTKTSAKDVGAQEGPNTPLNSDHVGGPHPPQGIGPNTLACANNSATQPRDRGQLLTGEVVEAHTERRDNTVVVRFLDIRGNEVTADVGNYLREPKPGVWRPPRARLRPPTTPQATWPTSGWDRTSSPSGPSRLVLRSVDSSRR